MARSEHLHWLSTQLRSPSRLAVLLLNLLVYYLLLRWVVDNIQPGRLVDHLGQIPLWALLGSVCINMVALTLYGARMALLLSRDFGTAFSVVNIGYALNTLVPFRLGEAMKIYLGRKLYGIPLVGVFAASVAEKLFDVLKLLLLGLVVAAFAAGELVQTSALFPIAILAVLGTVATILFRIYIVRMLKLLPKHGRLRRISIELHKHARSYPVRRVLAVSVCIWALNVALVFFTFNTYLLDVRIDILDATALLLVLSLSIAIPSAPAGIGLFEAGIVAYLTQKTSVTNEAALAAAAAFHLVITVPQLAITGCLLWHRTRRVEAGA